MKIKLQLYQQRKADGGTSAARQICGDVQRLEVLSNPARGGL